MGEDDATVDDTELMDAVRALRAKGSPPKAIARALGVPPARVAPLIKAAATEANAGSQAELLGCWVSPGWSEDLSINGDHDWPDVPDTGLGREGVALALVARSAGRGHITVCGYLVDVLCLGVKNALGPRRMSDGRALSEFREAYFRVYEEGAIEAPLDLVQHLVLGAVEYARGLGFEPHHDFAAAAGHLGEWSGPSDIVFGRDGKPIYVQGPYDNPRRVIETLSRTVGEGGFHYITEVPV
jgi:hypothetical protein